MTTKIVNHHEAVEGLLNQNPNITFDKDICRKVCSEKCLYRVTEKIKTMSTDITLQVILDLFLTDESRHSFLASYINTWKTKHGVA